MAGLSFLINAPERHYGIALVCSVAVYIITGFLSFIFNSFMPRISLDPMVYDPLWLSLFGLVLGVILFYTAGSNSAAMSKVSTIFVFGIICVVTAAANLVRLAIVFFGSAYYSSRLGVPMGFQIASVLAIDTISFLVVVKCSYQISRGQGSSQQINSLGINKLPLSIVMVINGIILFGLGVAILQERWTTYYTLSIHYHGVVLFITGVIGIISDKQSTYELNVWYKTVATYTLCISASAVVVLVQTVVFFIRDPQFTGWAQSDFAALTFLQAGFTLVGFIIAVLAYYSSDSSSDSQLLTNEEEQQYGSTINTTTNTGILISCLVAASMAIFSMALLGFPVYGYATLIVVSMAFTTFRNGLEMNICNKGVMKQTYMAASLFSGIGSFYAIGLVVYAFVGPNSITTNVGFRSFAYFYILMGLSIVALLPLMFFTCKITFQHFKSRSFASDASDPVTFSAKATEDVTVNIS